LGDGGVGVVGGGGGVPGGRHFDVTIVAWF
jgi:hypothetical protein